MERKSFKRKSCDIDGYVLSVSPKKTSQKGTKYIKLKMQREANKVEDVMVYDTGKEAILEVGLIIYVCFLFVFVFFYISMILSPLLGDFVFIF